jgi:pimeloyl-ACP methyl ester carboxylesterase
MKKFNLSTLTDAERVHFLGCFVRLSHGIVHYKLSGPERGHVVVLIPGLSVPFSIWDRNVPALVSAGFRVLQFDLYGRGFSDRPRVHYTLELFVQQVHELVTALRLAAPVSLVGYSMGGPIAASAALRLGLANTISLIDPLFQWREPLGIAALLKIPMIGDMIMMLSGGSLLADAQSGDFFNKLEYTAFLPEYLPQLAYRGFAQAVLSSIRSMPSWPLQNIYTELRHKNLPALLIWGQEDVTVPFADSSRLMSLLPDAHFVEIADAGHVPHWEQAEKVNSALIEFFKNNIV